MSSSGLEALHFRFGTDHGFLLKPLFRIPLLAAAFLFCCICSWSFSLFLIYWFGGSSLFFQDLTPNTKYSRIP